MRRALYCVVAHLLGSGWRARLREIQSRSAEEIAEERLLALLEHALATVPYYRDLAVEEPRLDAEVHVSSAPRDFIN